MISLHVEYQLNIQNTSNYSQLNNKCGFASHLSISTMSASIADSLDFDIPSPTMDLPQFEGDDAAFESPRTDAVPKILSPSKLNGCLDVEIPSGLSELADYDLYEDDEECQGPEYLSNPTTYDNYIEPICARKKLQSVNPVRCSSGVYPRCRENSDNRNSYSSATEEVILDPNSLDVRIPHTISVYADNGHFDSRWTRKDKFDSRNKRERVGNLYDNAKRDANNLDVCIPHTVSEYPERASNEDLVDLLLSARSPSDGSQHAIYNNEYDNTLKSFCDIAVISTGKDGDHSYLDVTIPADHPDYLEITDSPKSEISQGSKQQNNPIFSKFSEEMIMVDSEFYRPRSELEYAEVDPSTVQVGMYHYIEMDKLSAGRSKQQRDVDVTDSGVTRARTQTIIETNDNTPSDICDASQRHYENVIKPGIIPKKKIMFSRRILYAIIVVLLIVTIAAIGYIIYSQTKPIVTYSTANSTTSSINM